MRVLAKDADTQQVQGRSGSRSTPLGRVELASLSLESGEPTTIGQALADALFEQMRDTYLAMVDDLLGAEEGAGDPYTLETEQRLRERASGLAKGRLAQYQERLERFLATDPGDDTLAEWLAHRAVTDAGVWARLDSLGIRRQARLDYYARNRPVGGRWTILPEGAAEPRCLEVAGRVFDSYEEAEAALDSVWHEGCQHYVERVFEVRESNGHGDQEPGDELVAPGASTPGSPGHRLLPPRLRAARTVEDQIRTQRREIAVVFDRAGREILRKAGYHSSVPITRSERDRINGGTFTHNHPAGWGFPEHDPRRAGSSFSLEDIILAGWAHLEEMRAVTPAFRYSMRPGAKGWPGEDLLRDAFERVDGTVWRRLARRVTKGIITLPQAEAERLHEVWEVLGRQFGLRYSRERS